MKIVIDVRDLPTFADLLDGPLPDVGPLYTLAELLEHDTMKPWETEPFHDQFDAAGLRCRLDRNHVGVWCGAAGVPPTHPLFGLRRDALIVAPESRALNFSRIATTDLRGATLDADLPERIEAGDIVPLSVYVATHGGIWNTGAIDGDGLWYFAFMCGHQRDFRPHDPYVTSMRGKVDDATAALIFPGEDAYRDIDYARREVIELATQLAALDRVKLADTATTTGDES